MKTITISYLKDPLKKDQEIRVLSNRYKNEGMKAREARGRATREVDPVQNTQVVNIQYPMDAEPYHELVHDLAKGRDYKYIVSSEM